jgi:2-polyprenyl-3-methyl-5-hydroxy-6-metoxy-1,4-benzoquinol methylase
MIGFCDPRTGEPLVAGADDWHRGDGSAVYPRTDGVVRFVGDLSADVAQVQRVFHFEHALHERSHYVQFRPELVDEFLADCELPAEFFAGKDVLDAGCGSGRWSWAMSKLGARVHAMDLTAAGPEALAAELGERDDVRICQASLFDAPFPPASFDFVMSWGVLHHTPRTHAAFERIVPLVKPGGTLYVMVYRKAPVQTVGTELLRKVMRRMSDERRYEVCKRLVIRNKLVATALGPFLMVAHYDPETSEVDAETMQFGLFDAYSPRWNHTHSVAEVVGWFRDAGFREVTVIDPGRGNVRVRGVRPDA